MKTNTRQGSQEASIQTKYVNINKARLSDGKYTSEHKCKIVNSKASQTVCVHFPICPVFVTVFSLRMVLAELQSQEESYVAAMQALVNGYLEPLEQADPGLISNEMVLIRLHGLNLQISFKCHASLSLQFS